MHARELQIKDEAKDSSSICLVETTLDRRLSTSEGCLERTWLEASFRAASDTHLVSAITTPHIRIRLPFKNLRRHSTRPEIARCSLSGLAEGLFSGVMVRRWAIMPIAWQINS